MDTLAKKNKMGAVVSSHSEAEINRKLSSSEQVELLRKMLQIRRFEQVGLSKYQGGKMSGFIHLYIGQESVATGVCSLMGEHDHVITAYR